MRAYEVVPKYFKEKSIKNAFDGKYFKTFFFKERNSKWKRLQLFVWGGKEFFTAVEDDSYNQVIGTK